jgi:hypothetical protein
MEAHSPLKTIGREPMPMSFTIDRCKDLTVFTLSGEVSFQEFMSVLNDYGRQGPTFLELYDLRLIGGERLTTGEMNSLADFLSKHPDLRAPGNKTAIVVSEDIDYGFSRMISILTEDTTVYNIEVFRDIDEAWKWLAVDAKLPLEG